MEFTVQDNTIHIVSHKKHIVLDSENVLLDEMKIDCAWEYEKSGFLLYVRKWEQEYIFHFRIEGYWIGYIPAHLTEIDSEKLSFLGQLDILLMPAGKDSQKVIEQIDPKMIITYGEKSGEVPALFGESYEPVQKYKLKSWDISAEKTTCITLDV